MKNFILLFFLINTISFGQDLKLNKPASNSTKSSVAKEKTYVYNFNLTKITHITNPKAEVNVNLYQTIAAYKDVDQMIFPEVGGAKILGKLCPQILWGFKWDENSTCSVIKKNTQTFTNDISLGQRFKVRIKASELNDNSKVVFAILGASITYTNNKKYSLNKAHTRSLRLIDIIPGETNYFRYELSIDGARLLFDYVIERGVLQ